MQFPDLSSRLLCWRRAPRAAPAGGAAVTIIMKSAIDAPLLAHLERLPAACESLSDSHSTIYARAAELAQRLSVTAAFRERLSSELGSCLGCASHGRLTPAGKTLSTLQVLNYERSESRRETTIRTRAAIGSTLLQYSFSSDEHTACFSLRGDDAAVPLLRVQAVRSCLDATPSIATRVAIHYAALAALERNQIRSGLDVTALCHVLVGFLGPECLDEEWEMHEKVVGVLQRNQRRARARARARAAHPPRARWWCRKVWWRLRSNVKAQRTRHAHGISS